MLKKNTELTLTIDALGINGEGISHYDKFVIFIPFALVGEKVNAKILKVKNNIAFAKVLEVCTPADERVRPKCQVFGKCGGCQLQHLKYLSQIKHKAKVVKDCFYKIAAIDVEVLSTVKSGLVYNYRNKLQLPVRNHKGELEMGFFAENSHRIVPITNCSIHPDWVEPIVQAVKTYSQDFGICAYDEETKSGTIKHLLVREVGGKFLIGLVVTKQPDNIEHLVSILQKQFKTFSFFLNINDKDTNVVYGEKFLQIYGPATFEEEEQGIKYFVGPETFLQVNDYIRRRLYDKVTKSCDQDIVVDAFSGGGLLSAMLAKKAQKVYAIEIVKEAVECANALANYNNLSEKVVNIHGRVEDKLKDVVKEIDGKNYCLILDPPRKGCDVEVIRQIEKSAPEKIIYISCNSATLARDIGLITQTLIYSDNKLIKNPTFKESTARYEIEYIQPFDMFPHTKHIETLICLTRKH